MKALVLILLVASTPLFAQEKLEFGDTPTTNSDPKYKPDHRDHKEKRLIHWMKTSPKGLLTGNKCMEEVTNEMGFVYLIQLKGQAGYKSEFNRLIHNFGAKMGILVRNGPFWKLKLKKKTNECRRETGDYVG